MAEAVVKKVKAVEATPDNFKEYGQVIEPSADGDKFGPQDAQLDLSQGTPRFYIMRLENQPLKFFSITHHANVTQCLGAIGGGVWYFAVAKPSVLNVKENEGNVGGSSGIVQSHYGHFYLPPGVEEVRVFRFSGPKFVKLDRGTWHAGPLFTTQSMDFYNLELSNTNEVDRTVYCFKKHNGVLFCIDE